MEEGGGRIMYESNMAGKKEQWVEVSLLINMETDEIYAAGGDREPCSHGHPPCCDTKYIGYEYIKERINNV